MTKGTMDKDGDWRFFLNPAFADRDSWSILAQPMVTYSYDIFAIVLCSAVCLAALSMETARSFHRRPLLYASWFASSAALLACLPLSVIAPWPRAASALRAVALLSIAPAIISGALVLLLFIRRRPDDLVKRHEGLLLDSIRVGIVVFDAAGRIISIGRENPLPEVFVLDHRPDPPADHPAAFLSALLAAPEEAAGTARLDSRSFYWRFKPLPGGRGSLLTLLDTSREQELADSLERAGAALAARQRLLVSIERLDSEAARARIVEHVSGEIDREVRVKLKRFLSYAARNRSLSDCLGLAEESLAEVRSLVNELAPRREAP